MAVDYQALKAGGFMRQSQKDTFSLRLRVVGGAVTTEQLAAIKKVADKYGEGYIHLTSRQGIEIPFIKLKDIEEVKKELAEGGVYPGVCGPKVRTVTACQGGRCCPSGCIDAYDVAKTLDERYFGRKLPHKFKFGVTGCRNNCLKAEENDFGVKGGMVISFDGSACINCGVCEQACIKGAIKVADGKVTLDKESCNNCGRCVTACPSGAWKGTPGYIVTFGGMFGNEINKGREMLPILSSKDDLIKAADIAIEFFSENAEAGERFAKTLNRVGWDKLKDKLDEAF